MGTIVLLLLYTQYIVAVGSAHIDIAVSIALSIALSATCGRANQCQSQRTGPTTQDLPASRYHFLKNCRIVFLLVRVDGWNCTDTGARQNPNGSDNGHKGLMPVVTRLWQQRNEYHETNALLSIDQHAAQNQRSRSSHVWRQAYTSASFFVRFPSSSISVAVRFRRVPTAAITASAPIGFP